MLRSFLAVVVGLIPAVVFAGPIGIKLETTPPTPIPADFAGLSFETKRILPDKSYPDQHLFSASNTHLVTIFKTLGIRSLRIGGNTADRANVPIPETRDIDALFGFAKAADAKVIYTLRMKDTAPEAIVPVAKYLYAHHAPNLSHLVVGNEPNVYYKTFEEYHTALSGHLKVLTAAVPDAEFCGPCTTNAAPTWPARLAKDLPSPKLTLLAQHNYPCGNGQKATDPVAAVELLLSDLSPKYTTLLSQLREGNHAIPVRLEETSNFYLGGAPNASNTFASALWTLDYLHWWSVHGIAGVNFHASDYFPKTPDDKAVWYVPFARSASSGGPVPTWDIKPLAYGLKAFALVTGEGAVSVPLTLSNPDKANVTAYATRQGETTYLTLINKAKESAVFTLPAGLRATHTMLLSASSGDATTGISLGRSEITGTGAFAGEWVVKSVDSSVQLDLGPQSALLVKLLRE